MTKGLLKCFLVSQSRFSRLDRDGGAYRPTVRITCRCTGCITKGYMPGGIVISWRTAMNREILLKNVCGGNSYSGSLLVYEIWE